MILMVCICSRGLVHSRAMEGLDESLWNAGMKSDNMGYSWDRIWEHEQPIPEAQNRITARALERDPLWLLYLEEDILMRPETLITMLAEGQTGNHPVVASRYRNKGGTWAFQLNRYQQLVYSGMGCLLVSASLLVKLPQPWFDTQWNYSMDANNIGLRILGKRNGEYGGQDISLFYRLQLAQVRPFLSETEVQHLVIEAWGQAGVNNGCHQIVGV